MDASSSRREFEVQMTGWITTICPRSTIITPSGKIPDLICLAGLMGVDPAEAIRAFTGWRPC
jgi:hypothetical protein